MADEHVEGTALKLGAELKITFCEFEKCLNTPPHAVNPNNIEALGKAAGCMIEHAG